MAERVAIYCRLSEEDREKEGDNSQSIQNQRAMLRQYAQAHGWIVVAEWVDDDWAGTDRRRPGFRGLLQGAEHGDYDIVLCKTQSRFTRELELVEHYLHDCFPRWGVRFVSVVDHADTAVRGNKKARQINGLMNEWYLEDLSENIRAVLTSRRKRGFHIGSSALYGYQKAPNARGRLQPDPVTAPIVREIFARYAAGWNQKAIAQALNARREPSPAARKGQGTNAWRASTIGAILRNEMYCGVLVQGRYGSQSYKTRKNQIRPKELWYRVPGTHEPLISDIVWQTVQQRLQRNPHPTRTAVHSLWHGKVFCKFCDAPLRVTTTRGIRYLQCTARHADKDVCPGAFVAESAMQEAIQCALDALLEEHQQELQEMVRACTARETPEQDTEVANARARYEQSLQLLYLDRGAGKLSQETADDMIQRLQTDLKRLQEQESVRPEQTDPVQLLRKCTAQTECLPYLIERITVGRRQPGEREVPVCVQWRF